MAYDAVKRAAELERELAAAVDAARQETEDAVGRAVIPGVNRISKNVFTVKSGMLKESWSPDYFDAEGQKRRVHEKLSKVTTLSGLRNALKSLLDDRKTTLHPVISGMLRDALAEITAEAPQ